MIVHGFHGEPKKIEAKKNKWLNSCEEAIEYLCVYSLLNCCLILITWICPSPCGINCHTYLDN